MDEKLKQAIEELKLDKNIDKNFEYIYSVTKESTIRVIRHYFPSDVYRKTDVSTLELDLQQEVYVAVYKYIKTLKDTQSFPAWLGRITANTVLSYLRKNGNVLKMSSLDKEDEDGNAIELEDIDESKRPEVIAMKRTESEIVMKFVNDLPVAQRDALIAFYGDNIKIKDIAEASGVSENTIKTRLHYAKKALFSRKAEFKRHGIELTLIPFAVLIHSAYKADTSYAMGLMPGVSEKLAEYGETITKAALGTAAGSAGAAASGSAGATAASGEAAATSGSVAAGAATAKAVGTGIAVKATIAVAAVASAATVGTTVYKTTSAMKAETAMVQEQGDFANSKLNKKEVKNYQAIYAESLNEYAQEKHLSMKDMEIQFIDIDGDGIPEMYVHTGWKGIKAVIFDEKDGTASAAVESLDDSVGYYKGDGTGCVLTRHTKNATENISAHAASISAYNLYSLKDGGVEENVRYYVDEYDGSQTACRYNGDLVSESIATEIMTDLTNGLEYSFIDPTADTAMSYNELRASAGMSELSEEELSSYVVYQAMYADILQEYANETEKSLDNMEILFADVDSNGFPEMFMRINDPNFPDEDRIFIYAKDNGEIKLLGKGGKGGATGETVNNIDGLITEAYMHIEKGPYGYISITYTGKETYDSHFYEVTDDHFEEIVNRGWTGDWSNTNRQEYGYIRGESVGHDAAFEYEKSLYHSQAPTYRGEEEESDYNTWGFDADGEVYYSDLISYEDLLKQYTDTSQKPDSGSVENTEAATDTSTSMTGKWMGRDSLTGLKVIYEIKEANVIEYTVDGPETNGQQHGSTTFRIDGDTMYLKEGEDGLFPLDSGGGVALTGGGVLTIDGENFSAQADPEGNIFTIYSKM